MSNELRPRVKLWIQSGKDPVAGEGRVELLLAIEKEKSLNRAAAKLGMSYRHAWGVIKELEQKLGFNVVEAERGGASGGSTRLTKQGQKLVREYKQMSEAIGEIVKEKTFWEGISTKLSARNRLSGVIESVKIGEVGATVKMSVKPGEITAFITREAAEDLELKKGDRVEAVVKATEVMIAKP
ncbi:MAG: TOBE domain-containing protein [Candidatus Hadarchaeota archaeon]